MIKWIIALIFLSSLAWAGIVSTIAGTGSMSTVAGVGSMTISTFTIVSAPPSGTTGQCIGILCGVTYSN